MVSTRMTTISRIELTSALQQLGELASKSGEHIEMVLVGGAHAFEDLWEETHEHD